MFLQVMDEGSTLDILVPSVSQSQVSLGWKKLERTVSTGSFSNEDNIMASSDIVPQIEQVRKKNVCVYL